jgi:membrane-bound lytic murein transglycosylase B
MIPINLMGIMKKKLKALAGIRLFKMPASLLHYVRLPTATLKKNCADLRVLTLNVDNGTALRCHNLTISFAFGQIVPDRSRGDGFLVCHNFLVIMRYNISISYAFAVCELADQIQSRASNPG